MRTTLLKHLQLPPIVLAALTALSASAQTSEIKQSRAAITRGDSDAAIAIMEKAVAQYPNDAEAHYCLFEAYGSKAMKSGMLSAMKLGPKAKAECEKAVALNPKHIEARLELVQMYAGMPGIMGGSHEKAFEQAKEIKALDPLRGHRAYALVYVQEKKLDLAKKEYLDAIREQPDSAKAHSYLGQYLTTTEKNYTAAFAEFEDAIKLDPNYMPATYHIGRTAALAKSNLSRGEQALKQYLAYTPKNNEPTLASANYYLGLVYENEGKKVEAKQSYQAALKLNPTHKLATEALKRVS